MSDGTSDETLAELVALATTPSPAVATEARELTIVFTGDRHGVDEVFVGWVLDDLVRELGAFTVVHGEGSGYDRLVGRVATQSFGLPVIPVAAWWELGPCAGPLRNKRMLDEHTPSMVVALHDDLPNSRGTRDCLRQAQRRGVPTRLYTHVRACQSSPSEPAETSAITALVTRQFQVTYEPNPLTGVSTVPRLVTSPSSALMDDDPNNPEAPRDVYHPFSRGGCEPEDLVGEVVMGGGLEVCERCGDRWPAGLTCRKVLAARQGMGGW